MSGLTADDLRAEAVFLARRAFGIALRPEDAARYATAHEALAIGPGSDADPALGLLQRAMARNADVEALEFALRLSNRRNVITRKLHVLAFLIEADPRCATHFVNDVPGAVRARLALAAHGVRAVWKYALGQWLRWRLARQHA